MSVILPIAAWAFGVWCGFGVACLIVAGKNEPKPPEGDDLRDGGGHR